MEHTRVRSQYERIFRLRVCQRREKKNKFSEYLQRFFTTKQMAFGSSNGETKTEEKSGSTLISRAFSVHLFLTSRSIWCVRHEMKTHQLMIDCKFYFVLPFGISGKRRLRFNYLRQSKVHHIQKFIRRSVSLNSLQMQRNQSANQALAIDPVAAAVPASSFILYWKHLCVVSQPLRDATAFFLTCETMATSA